MYSKHCLNLNFSWKCNNSPSLRLKAKTNKYWNKKNIIFIIKDTNFILIFLLLSTFMSLATTSTQLSCRYTPLTLSNFVQNTSTAPFVDFIAREKRKISTVQIYVEYTCFFTCIRRYTYVSGNRNVFFRCTYGVLDVWVVVPRTMLYVHFIEHPSRVWGVSDGTSPTCWLVHPRNRLPFTQSIVRCA